MKRSYLFFLFSLLWESAIGFGVWNEQPAQNWQRSEEKTIQNPPSLSSEQQASSVASGVQSIELETTNSEGSSNVPTRHVQLKPNGLGVSSYGDEFNATDAQSAGRQSSSTQGFHSTRPSKPFISPRRPIPLSNVGVPLGPQRPTIGSLMPQQDGFGIKLSYYSSGFASGRPSSQMPPQNLPTQYVPVFQTQASNVAPSQSLDSAPVPSQQEDTSAQSASEVQRILLTSWPTSQAQSSNLLASSQSLGSAPVPPRQDGYGIPSRWSAPQVQGIPSASRPALQTQPSGFVAQPSNLVAPSQSLGSAPVPPWQESYGIPSRWSSSQVQGIPSATRPVLQNQPSNFVPPSQSLGSAPVQLQQVQRIPLVAQHTFQTQPSNLLAQTQSLESAPVPSQQGGYDNPSRWSAPQMQGIPIDSRPALQTQPSNILAPYQSLGNAPLQSQQDGYGIPSRWSSSQVQGIPSASRPVLQNQPSDFAPPSQRVGSAPVPSQQVQRIPLAAQHTFQTQPLNILAPSQSLGSAPVPSQQGGYGIPSRWSTPRVQGIPSASQPALQTQPSNILAPYQSLGNAPLQSQQDRDAFQSRWPAAEINSIFLNRRRFQNQVSNFVAPSQSVAGLPRPLQEEGYGFQSRRSSSQMQGIPSATLPVLQTQPSNFVAPFQSLGSAPVQSLQDSDSFYTRWPAAEIPNVPSSAQPIFQGHLSDIVASHEHLSGASLPSQHNRYGPQSSFFISRGQNIPLTAGPALNRMAPSQSFSNALRLSAQDGYNAQSRWPASHERIPSASQPPQYGPMFQTQSSSRPVPSSWGLANQYTSQYTSQGSRSQNAPADQSPQAQLSGVAVSGYVGSSSLPTSLQSQDVPLSRFDGLHQGPPVQTQSLYKPVFPSQERTSVFSSLSQAQARADPSEHVLCFKVSSAALAEALQSNKPVTQPQSLESLLYNPTASSSLPSLSQRQSASALTAAQTQSGVQPPAVVYRSRFPPSTQKPAKSTASVAQSVSSSPAKTSAEHFASDLSKKIPGDSWTELTIRDLD